jgi:hypothetical protein
MPFYKNRVYPHLVRILGNPKPVQEIRQRLLPLAQGEVLEIGVGPGVNFVHYDPARVSKVYALEPNPGMVPRAEEQGRRTQLNVEFLDLPGERGFHSTTPVLIRLLARSRCALFPVSKKLFEGLAEC